MPATVVDTEALLKTVAAACVAGVGVTLIFSLAIVALADGRGGGDGRDNRHDPEVGSECASPETSP